jgi:hypothetical protein
MPSTLQVDTIKDASATNTLFDQSGSDWVWGSAAPAGTIIKVTTHSSTAEIQISSSTSAFESDANDITISCVAGNKLHIQIAGGNGYPSASSGFYFGAGMRIVESGESDVDVYGGGIYARETDYESEFQPSIIYSHTAVTSSVTVKAAMFSSGTCTAYWEAPNSAGRGARRYLIMEEQA